MSADPAGPAPGSSNLVLRLVAAGVMVPAALALAWAGGWFWIALVGAAACGLYSEWAMIVGAAGWSPVVVAGVVLVAVTTIALGLAPAGLTLLALVLAGSVLTGALAASQRRLWTMAGFVYAMVAAIASVLMRQDPGMGLVALLFVFFVVWASDIGGYFAGRAIGGAKLWPRVSPKKTWAGAIGGLLASMAVAACFGVFGVGRLLPLIAVGAGLAVVSQCGDLFESAVKRHFGVKDSSQIIPGHGGLMDRLDGFVAAIVVAAIMGFLRGGVDGVAGGLMIW